MTLPGEDHIVSRLSRLTEFAPLRKSSHVSGGLDHHHLTVHLLSQRSLANACANKNRKKRGRLLVCMGALCTCQSFLSKVKTFGKYKNFFKKKKELSVFTVKERLMYSGRQ